jgi:hypothetical protein
MFSTGLGCGWVGQFFVIRNTLVILTVAKKLCILHPMAQCAVLGHAQGGKAVPIHKIPLLKRINRTWYPSCAEFIWSDSSGGKGAP